MRLCSRLFSGVVLVAAVGALLGCGGGGGPTNGTPPPPPPPPPPAVPGADVTINLSGEAFVDPQGRRNTEATVTINVGQTVGWTNSDGFTHSVTSGEGTNGTDGDGLPAGAAAFDRELGSGDSTTITFEIAGTYTYYCRFHPTTMFNATIIVQ